jgi:hypothetical protein
MLRLLIAGIALAFVALAASAHSLDEQWGYWFLIQRNMRGASCCDISHAHALKEEDWRNRGKHYQVRINDRWYDVEDWQMLKPADPNPTGNAILWYNDIGGGAFFIYCFTPSHET